MFSDAIDVATNFLQLRLILIKIANSSIKISLKVYYRELLSNFCYTIIPSNILDGVRSWPRARRLPDHLAFKVTVHRLNVLGRCFQHRWGLYGCGQFSTFRRNYDAGTTRSGVCLHAFAMFNLEPTCSIFAVTPWHSR